MKRSLPVLISGALLGLFGVVGAGLVGLSHDVTATRIEQNERDALLQRLQVLVPLDSIDNDLLTDVLDVSAPKLLGTEVTRIYRGRRGDEPAALVMNPVVTQGYSGSIKLIVAVNSDGTLGGVRVLSHRETPGLGDKIEAQRSDWIDRFKGKSLLDPVDSDWKVRRDGGVFDQFTGATITPRAVVRGIRNSLVFFNDNKLNLFERDEPVVERNDE
jgi:electron transport complex protein RnfG